MPQNLSTKSSPLRYSPLKVSTRSKSRSTSSNLSRRNAAHSPSSSHMSPSYEISPSHTSILALPNELQLEILSSLPTRELFRIATVCKRYLDIIVYIVAQRCEMWASPTSIYVITKTYHAAKLWLSSQQGREASSSFTLVFLTYNIQEVKCSTKFLSLVSTKRRQFPSIRVCVSLDLAPSMAVERPLLERFLTLILLSSHSTISFTTAGKPPLPRRSGLRDCAHLSLPSSQSIHNITIYDSDSFLCDLMLRSSPKVEQLTIAESTRSPERWDILSTLRFKNLSELHLSIELPAYVVRVLIKHHPMLVCLETKSATIVDDDSTSRSLYGLKGLNHGLTKVTGIPKLMLPMLQSAAFPMLERLEIHPEREPYTLDAFLQSVLSGCFSSEGSLATAVHLILPSPTPGQSLPMSTRTPKTPAHVKGLWLKFPKFDSIGDILVSIPLTLRCMVLTETLAVRVGIVFAFLYNQPCRC